MPSKTEVAITGVGLGCALGNTFDSVAESLLAGQSGVRPITHFDASQHPSQFAGWMGPLPSPPGWDEADDFAGRDPWEQLLLWCTVGALQDAGLWDTRQERRIGLVLGIGGEWMRRWENDLLAGGNRISDPPQDREGFTPLGRKLLNLQGPCARVAAACASGNVALSVGRDWLRRGVVDFCLAGAIEVPVSPFTMAGFGKLGALSKRNDAPAAASRPFDKDRDGFVMGDGGAVFVLESWDSARKRSAKLYGEIAGCGSASDAFHMVSPGEDPRWGALAIERALGDANIAPDDLDYINAHGTATPLGDIFETRALHAALGESAAVVPISATKSMTGHLLGGASALEAAICLMAFKRQAIPPTINLEEVDSECSLNHVAHRAIDARVQWAMSGSFGFGGSNTCLVLRKAA
jgi:3-oxoacyl-[acyl-carrier-protein] synthase II